MGVIVSLLLIICGCLGAYQAIVAKKPEAAKIIDEIAPHKTWIGLLALVWGVVSLLHAVSIIGFIGIWWVVYVLSGICCSTLGFLFSYDFVASKLLKTNDANDKAAAIRDKLIPLQTNIGFLAIGLGFLGLILMVVY